MKTGDNKLEVNIKLDRSQQSRTRQWLFCPSACPRFNFVPPHFAAELASSLFLCAPTALSPPGETVDASLLPVRASHSSDRTKKTPPKPPPRLQLRAPSTADRQTERTLRGLQARVQCRPGGV